MSPLPFRVCLLTRHRKSAAVAPAFGRAGFVVEEIDSFDTDTLGTFSGETERQGTMRDAALTKARLACQLGASRYGLGSEGSFGTNPFIGLSAWGRELLVLWDAELGYAVKGFAQGPETNWKTREVASVEDALHVAREAGFPGHGLLLGRPGGLHFDKARDEACSSEAAFTQRIRDALADGPVTLQTDMRAHRNPQRMAMIARAANALVDRLAQRCPSCAAPGHGPFEAIPGSPCEACGAPTRVPVAERWACPRCGHREDRPLAQRATPDRCDHCNP